MGLLDIQSESDFMVNAEDPIEGSEDLDDEYIPLNVGMGWGRKGSRLGQGSSQPVRNYGSAMTW
jgi:hypothetical protein